MKISKETLAILQSFQSINSGMVFRKGNVLKTYAPKTEHAYGEAHVPEQFPMDFAIYELSRFLAAVNLHTKKGGDCELDFQASQVVIGNKAKTKYKYTDIDLVLSEPTGEIPFEADISFELTEQDIKWLFGISSVLGVHMFTVESDGNGVTLNACDIKGIIEDGASMEVANYKGVPFKFILKKDNVTVLDSDYTVEFSHHGAAKFSSKKYNLFYYFSLEEQSTYAGTSIA